MKYILIALAILSAALLFAQESAQLTRYREVQTLPAGLRTALNNVTDTVRAARTNSVRTVIRITVTVEGGSTNTVAQVEETVPFREVQ